MERIFEDYVAHRLRPKLGSYFEGCTLKTQAATDSLVENHNDKPIFKLKPDLLIIKGVETVCVMDTKWKLLDASNHLNKYGISQADMYQLYAYGHKYLKKSKPPKKLMLVYPKTDKFEKRLPLFEYEKGEKGLKLDVVPFDLNEGVLIDERYPSGS